MKLYTSKILLLILIFIVRTTFAQSYSYKIYSTNEGLPSPECYQVLQDHKGFIWVCTDNGISRFDGYRFKNFGPKEGLKEVAIMEIQEDNSGTLWARSLSGRIYKINNDTVMPYKYNSIIDLYNTPLSFHFHFDEAEKKMYVEVNSTGFLVISSNGQFRQINPEKKTSVFCLNLNDKFIYTNTKSLYSEGKLEIRTKADDFQQPNTSCFMEKYNHVGKSPIIVKKLNDNFVLFQANHQTGIIKNNKLLWKRDLRRRETANSILIDTDGSFLLANIKKGGWRHYKNQEAFKRNDYTSIIDNISVTSGIKDNMGGYWMTSLEKGLFYFPNLRIKIYNQASGLPEDIIPAMDLKSKNEILLSSISGQIGILNTQNNKFTKYTSIPGRAYDILSINDSMYWYASSENLVLFEKQKTYFISNTSKKLYRTPNKQATWVLSRYGAVKVSSKKKKILFSTASLIDNKFKRTFSILKDSKQNLWIGNMQGLSIFKKERLISQNYLHPSFSNRIEEMAETSDSTLVLGIKGDGLILWKNQLFSQITKKDGLTSSMVEKIHVDNLDNIWVGTLSGLNRIWKKNGHWKVQQFTTKHGLPSNEIWEILTTNKEVWCATSKGIARFTPTPQQTYSPRPKIQEIHINSQSSLNKNYDKLKYSENNIDIKYVSLNYAMCGQIPYRYRASKKHSWTYTYSTKVHFSSLAAGQYTFAIQAQNQDSFWSNSTNFTFRVLLPWWKTWWFVLSLIFMIGIIIYLIYNGRLILLKREIELQQEIMEVEKAALVAQMNPHFLFNTLNSIQNMILTNDKRKATVYLANFANLVRSTLDASSKKYISLSDEINYLNSYLKLEQNRFGQMLEFEIIPPKGIILKSIIIPPLLIQPLVENALVHGLSKDKPGFISINYTLKKNKLFVSVLDNGIGLKPKLTKKTNHKSYGINLVQKRLNLLNNQNSSPILNIRELLDNNGVCQGTKASYFIKVTFNKPVIY